MKLLTKTSIFFTFTALLILSSCTKDEVKSITLSKSSITVRVGQADSILTTVTITGDIAKQPLTWTAGDSKIISLKEGASNEASGSFSKTIVVSGLTAGKTDIIIQVGDKKVICPVTVNQTVYSFKKVSASNWGDYYDIGNNSFDMYLLENSLTVSDSGKIRGVGTFLYLDFSVPITQNSIIAGNFVASNKGELNTFFPGDFQNNQVFGTRFVTIRNDSTIISLVKDGSYTITSNGDNFLIEGDLTSVTNEIIHFSYTGPIPLADKAEKPVELFPKFTKGELVYYGDAYKSGVSNNFVAYLATKDVNFADSILNGELLQLELNTALTAKDSIPKGIYSMMSSLSTTNLIPSTLVPGYITQSGNRWGCWYYGTTNKSLRTGNATISRLGNQYTIVYKLFDRFGSKISGIYTGPLTYIDGTKTASGVSAASKVQKSNVVKSFNPTKSISKIPLRANKIKSLRIN